LEFNYLIYLNYVKRIPFTLKHIKHDLLKKSKKNSVNLMFMSRNRSR